MVRFYMIAMLMSFLFPQQTEKHPEKSDEVLSVVRRTGPILHKKESKPTKSRNDQVAFMKLKLV